MGTLTVDQCTDAIARHSAGFAAAAHGHLDVRVPSCPDWTVRDLVRHLSDVHWFWATIAEERLSEPPAEERRPAPPLDADLITRFEEGARRLVEVLGSADQEAACWTWADQRNVAFVTRHQVQEAAVHHWDVANAVGAAVELDAAVAEDAVDEFLTVSLVTEDEAKEQTFTPLAGAFVLRAAESGRAWTVRDGTVPGSVVMSAEEDPDLPALEAPAADLLLWLYRRIDLASDEVPADLLGRFRDDTFTD